MIQTLQSIEQVEIVFDTGDKPVLVHCDDMNFYVCKYNRTTGSANLLFREFICASFLKLWGLKVPNFCFVYLQSHHNPEQNLNIKNGIPCFGLQHNNEYKEVDAFTSEMSNPQKARFKKLDDLILLALFDYWVSNDDRNHNNYNLMLNLVENEYQFIPIDGGAIFHTGTQNRENYPLTEDETLLGTPLFTNLLQPNTIITTEYIENLKEKYYFCTRKCNEELLSILGQVPAEWLIQSEQEIENLNSFLFSDDWLTESFNTFESHLKQTLQINDI